MATATEANKLSTYYISKFEELYRYKPSINRNKARWSWENILQDYTPTQVRRLIDYYFSIDSSKGHDINTFFYNYDKIIVAMQDAKRYAEERQKMMNDSRLRAQKWKEQREGRTKGN